MEVFITKQNFGEEENIISLCHEEYYDASGSNFKRSRKEERHKTLITRECASLHLFHAVLIFFFASKNGNCVMYRSFIKTGLVALL